MGRRWVLVGWGPLRGRETTLKFLRRWWSQLPLATWIHMNGIFFGKIHEDPLESCIEPRISVRFTRFKAFFSTCFIITRSTPDGFRFHSLPHLGAMKIHTSQLFWGGQKHTSIFDPWLHGIQPGSTIICEKMWQEYELTFHGQTKPQKHTF